jgi:Co/Zn/Cd efflux system component
LAGYTSAVVLGMIALLIAYQSFDRLLHPVAIAYDEAIAIAALGLTVNLTSAWLLRDEHHYHVDAGHDHHGHDLNLCSRLPAYRWLGRWAGDLSIHWLALLERR